MEGLANRLRKLRKENNLTQADLANELSFSKTTIANYEQGLRTPNIETLNEISNYFNVSFDYLLGKSNKKTISKCWLQESNNIIFTVQKSNLKIKKCSIGACSFYGYERKSLIEMGLSELSVYLDKALNNRLEADLNNIFFDIHKTNDGFLYTVKIISLELSHNLLTLHITPIKKEKRDEIKDRITNKIVKNKKNSKSNNHKDYYNRIQQKYISNIMAGNESLAFSELLSCLNRDLELSEIYLKILKPSFDKLDQLVENNKIDFDEIYYFTQKTKEVMAQLKLYFPKNSLANRNTVIAFTLSNESHDIGLKMISDYFEINGWNTIFLGSKSQISYLLSYLYKYNPQIILISVANIQDSTLVKYIIKTIREIKSVEKTKIIVGGRAFDKNQISWKNVNADAYAVTPEEALEKANSLIN